MELGAAADVPGTFQRSATSRPAHRVVTTADPSARMQITTSRTRQPRSSAIGSRRTSHTAAADGGGGVVTTGLTTTACAAAPPAIATDPSRIAGKTRAFAMTSPPPPGAAYQAL